MGGKVLDVDVGGGGEGVVAEQAEAEIVEDVEAERGLFAGAEDRGGAGEAVIA